MYGKPQTDKDVSPIAGRYNGDSVFYCPTQVLVDKLRELAETRKGFKMSQFRFDVAMQRLTELAPGLGAMHVGELPFVFNPEDTTPLLMIKPTEPTRTARIYPERRQSGHGCQAQIGCFDSWFPVDATGIMEHVYDLEV